ncbi:MAG: T9SS type A sorting domain-containing protein [Ignavibacteria bacterium]|nr:T9SS type A sorting domain-containing protein [Ignavibacteria bacterium]
MKENNFIIAIIFLLIFQASSFSQKKDEPDYTRLGVDSRAVEITAKRTPYCRTFLNPNGSFTAVIAPVVELKGQTDESTLTLHPHIITPRRDQCCYYTYAPLAWTYKVSLGQVVENGHSGINRCILMWNTEDIPEDATISSTSSQFTKGFNTNSSATDVQFYAIHTNWSVPPPVNQEYDVYNDCENGTLYSTVSTGTGSGVINFTGSTDFNSDLKTRLAANWMGLGLKNSDEATASKYFNCNSSDDGYLVVHYTTPPKLKVTPASWTGAPGDGGGLENILVENSGTEGETLDFTAEVISGGDWIELVNTYGYTPGSISIQILPNFTGAVRNGSVKISAKDVADIYMSISQNLASTLTLPAQEISGLQTYKVINTIEANSFLVGSGGNIGTLNLYAGTSITLKPGFHAKSDAGTFLARIQTIGEDEMLSSSNTHNKEILALKEEKNSGSKVKDRHSKDNLSVDPIPTEYDLFQNYPNPFNPNTTIRFALPEKAIVKLAVYNLLGQQVAEIASTEFNAGYHNVNFNGSSLSSGIYFYRISTAKFSKTLKLLLVK